MNKELKEEAIKQATRASNEAQKAVYDKAQSITQREQLERDKLTIEGWEESCKTAALIDGEAHLSMYGINQLLKSVERVTQVEERRKYITEVLADQHKSELEGKGYDFYFKLRTDLDQLKQDNE